MEAANNTGKNSNWVIITVHWDVVASQEILRGVGKACTWPKTQGENWHVKMCPKPMLTLR